MQAVLLSLLGVLMAFTAGVWCGRGIGETAEYAKRKREEAIIQGVQDAATTAAANEIAKIKPRNVTIRQEVEREIHTNTVYRDARHTSASMQLINEALTGQREQETAPVGKLP